MTECFDQMNKHLLAEPAEPSAVSAVNAAHIAVSDDGPTVSQEPGEDEVAVYFPCYVHHSQPVLPACDSLHAPLLISSVSAPALKISTSSPKPDDCHTSTASSVVTPDISESEQAQASPLSTLTSYPIDCADYEGQLASHPIDFTDYEQDQLGSHPIVWEHDEDASVQPIDATGSHSHLSTEDQDTAVQCHAIQLDDDKDDLLDDATGFAVEGAGDDEYTDYVANNLAALTDSPDLLDEQFACNR